MDPVTRPAETAPAPVLTCSAQPHHLSVSGVDIGSDCWCGAPLAPGEPGNGTVGR